MTAVKVFLIFILIILFVSESFAETVVPFRYKQPSKTESGYLKYVTIHINGVPVEAIFDTGASNLSLSQETLQKIGSYKMRNKIQTRTAGGTIDGYAFSVDSISIQNIEIKNVTGTTNEKLDVNLVGGKMFKNFNFYIDEDSRTITFVPRNSRLSQSNAAGQSSDSRVIVDERKNSYLEIKVKDRDTRDGDKIKK